MNSVKKQRSRAVFSDHSGKNTFCCHKLSVVFCVWRNNRFVRTKIILKMKFINKRRNFRWDGLQFFRHAAVAVFAVWTESE